MVNFRPHLCVRIAQEPLQRRGLRLKWGITLPRRLIVRVAESTQRGGDLAHIVTSEPRRDSNGAHSHASNQPSASHNPPLAVVGVRAPRRIPSGRHVGTRPLERRVEVPRGCAVQRGVEHPADVLPHLVLCTYVPEGDREVFVARRQLGALEKLRHLPAQPVQILVVLRGEGGEGEEGEEKQEPQRVQQVPSALRHRPLQQGGVVCQIERRRRRRACQLPVAPAARGSVRPK